MTDTSANNEAWLVLSDGTAFRGLGFGARTTRDGEVVFNTSMTGYPELLTDPSYRRQLLTLTVAEVGNYGICHRDGESDAVQAAGLVVRSLSRTVSNWRSNEDLSSYLARAGVPGIADIDTRALVRKLRTSGTMTAVLSTDGTAPLELLRRARAAPPMAGAQLIADVSTQQPYVFSEAMVDDAGTALPSMPERFHVVAYDFGMKKNMARMLVARGCRVTVVPYQTTAAAVRALQPDGVLLSNGPGDPSTVPEVVAAVRELVGVVPVFGICMGHQILGQALGANTYKTAFGHRGGNQPVITDAIGEHGRVLITSQNHGFAVRTQALPAGVVANETNLSDGSNEGLSASDRMAFSVQYHPEAAPGPHDAAVHFDRFITMMEQHRGAQA
jgi:carbamoyl-phosphate synthase small subunit